MKIDFQHVHIPTELQNFTKEVVNGVPVTSIPKGWPGILIYHPATQQYYSTKSVEPLRYEEIVRLRQEPRWSSIAIALRKMLDNHSDFQFFIFPMVARPGVENWMASQGYQRIATRMGEGDTKDLILFKVYSRLNKTTRYITASSTTPKEKIIKQANTGYTAWLASGTRVNHHERETMRDATRSKFSTNTKVFEQESKVERTNLLAGHTANEFRAICSEMNIKAVREFIQSTVTG